MKVEPGPRSREKAEKERVIRPLAGRPVKLDLERCEFHGVTVPDWPRYYTALLGEPSYTSGALRMYPAYGISLNFLERLGKIWVVYFWLSEIGAEEPFPGKIGEFKPCQLHIITRNGGLRPSTATTRDEIRKELGEPFREEETEVEAALEYKLEASNGNRMSIMFEFAMPEKLLGVIVG